jgi:hypothetical protein
MFRKSILITLISTAAVALAINDASARGAMGTAAGARAANPGYVPHINAGPTFDKGFVRPYARSGGATIKWSRFNAKVAVPYVNSNAAVQIKPSYGSTLKPLPVPPIAAAKNDLGAKIIPPASATPSTPPHWPHKPGFYGTPAITAAPVLAPASVLADPLPASVAPTRFATATGSVPAQQLQASPGGCTCLTKQYTPQGAVVFMDRCTNEVAMTAPQQTGAVAPNQMPQQLPLTK